MYDSKLVLFLEHKEKEKMRKNAYKNKMTMSDYVRKLILLDNRINELGFSQFKSSQVINDIKKVRTNLGRND